ncbi:hypothetical protein BV898_03812 [Hypsibius exemplaris]|uniref:Uncharacterized protein n=1 Tax=Hypsibius exemplaris TaxID=2072580 RepID=A0A1W0X4U8_HYPEX|nr:hypothetical protein BV898_03812 [Hypsibius exemplaris]
MGGARISLATKAQRHSSQPSALLRHSNAPPSTRDTQQQKATNSANVSQSGHHPCPRLVFAASAARNHRVHRGVWNSPTIGFREKTGPSHVSHEDGTLAKYLGA